jgi:prepilin-type N-terminal cleavage/methylation domain-containing protein
MLKQPRRNRHAEGGFTLVELLVVMILLGVIGSIVTSSVITAFVSTRRGEQRVHALNDLQKGIERVGRELRAADPLILEAGKDPAEGIGAEVIRNGQRIEYRYYLVDLGDGVELREDVVRRALDGQVDSQQQGLFIADIGNLEKNPPTPLFTYYYTDPGTRQLREIDCDADGLTESQCLQRHTTATQVRLTLEKLLPEHGPIKVETVVNIRSVRLGG